MSEVCVEVDNLKVCLYNPIRPNLPSLTFVLGDQHRKSSSIISQHLKRCQDRPQPSKPVFLMKFNVLQGIDENTEDWLQAFVKGFLDSFC